MAKKKKDNSVVLNIGGERVRYLPKRYDKFQKDEILLILLVLIPQLILTAVLYIYVNIDSLTLAFKNSRGDWTTSTLKYAWSELTSLESEFGTGLINTAIFFAKNMVMLFFQLVICYFLYKKIKFARFFQIIMFLPTIISSVATITVFKNVIDAKGPLGVICDAVGIDLPQLLGADGYKKEFLTSNATWTILFYSVWTGWAADMLLFSGAMARIPVELLESAKLEGIRSGREIRSIIFPLIWPTFSTVLILNFTTILSAGGPILLFDKYAVMNTWTVGYYLFYKVLINPEYNFVSAMGLYLTAFTVPVILILRKLVDKIPAVEY